MKLGTSATNSTAKWMNLTAIAPNSAANGVKVPNSAANETKSIAIMTDSIAKTCNRKVT